MERTRAQPLITANGFPRPREAGGKHVLVLASQTHSLLNFRGPMMRAMLANGHRVSACAPDRDTEVIRALRDMGVEFHLFRLQRTGQNPLQDARSLLAVRDLIARLRPDQVLSYTIKPVIYGSLGARLAGVRERYAMISGLGYAFGEAGMRRRALNRALVELYRASLRGSKAVFFQNPDDLALFLNAGIVNERQAVLINGSGVDLTRFRPAPLEGDRPTFLLIARLIEEKGVIDYVEAARLVKRRHPQATFRLAGWFDDNPSAIPRERVQGWHDEGLIEFLGLLDDVRPALAACTAYVLPSYYREGVPRTILEALATGRPVVTTDSAGCRETVIPNVNGYLVPTHDPAALAERLIRLIEQPLLAQEMGRQSLELARRKYDVNLVNGDILRAMGLERPPTLGEAQWLAGQNGALAAGVEGQA